MNCEDFFRLAIDPDEKPDPSLLPEIDEHRSTCKECQELERDYAKLREVAATMPSDLVAAPPDEEEKVMKAAREAFVARATTSPAPERSSRSMLLVAAAVILGLTVLGTVLWRLGYLSSPEQKTPAPQTPSPPPETPPPPPPGPFKPRDGGGIDLGDHH